MMQRYTFLLINLIFWHVCISGTMCQNRARYDNYRVYQVKFDTQQQVQVFQQLEESTDSLMFIGHAREVQQRLPIMVASHKVADFEELLKAYKVDHRILTLNFQSKIDKSYEEVLPRDVSVEKYDWNHYFHLETIDLWLEHQAKNHPNTVTLLNMGVSTQGLPMKGLRISHNSSADQAIFIESGIHAREWIAPATATYIINELLNSNDPNVRSLAEGIDWYIFPVVNPDGYKFTFTGDRMWRKNRQLFGVCYGVDLNRNYPFHWNTTGTSGDPCRYDYSGPEAASEMETKNLISFIKQNFTQQKHRAYFALHSYSQMIMFPYGHTAERVENYEDLKEIGAEGAKRIKETSGRVYKSGSIFETIYPSSGGSKDWAYGEMKIPITFTFELRGLPDSEDLFLLPAEQIKATAQEAFAAIIGMVQLAKTKGYFE